MAAKQQGRKVLLKTPTPPAPPEPEKTDPPAPAADAQPAQKPEEPTATQTDQATEGATEGAATGGSSASDPLKAPNGASGRTPGAKMTVQIGNNPNEPVDVGHADGQKRLPWTQPHYPGMPRHGIVLGPTDPVYVRGVHRGPVVELTEDVFRALKPSTSHNFVFNLVANKGQRVDSTRCILITDRDPGAPVNI